MVLIWIGTFPFFFVVSVFSRLLFYVIVFYELFQSPLPNQFLNLLFKCPAFQGVVPIIFVEVTIPGSISFFRWGDDRAWPFEIWFVLYIR